MNTCKMTEDLLPLYEEGLLSDDTTQWIEAHFAKCEVCSKLQNDSLLPEELPAMTQPYKSAKKMMQHAQFKIAAYQLLLVMLSFIVAIQTNMLSGSFRFILTYFLLGAVTFAFYRSWIITLGVSFVPIFCWTILEMLGAGEAGVGTMLIGGLFVAAIHTLFCVVGVIVMYLLFIVFDKEDI